MIYCFSGTGNTLHVARILSSHIGCGLHNFTPEELRDPSSARLKSDDRLIVWAFPTYSWGVPPVVRRLIRQAVFDFDKDAVHIAVTTCGDDIGSLAAMFRRDINDRGLNAGAVFSVQMPNTYVMMKGFDVDPDELAAEKVKNASERVNEIADLIRRGYTDRTHDMTVKGSFASFKTRVIYPWFVRYDMSPAKFNVNRQACIHCGKCAKVCPMNNITYNKEGFPEWGAECAFCTACYHVCPVHAVGWGKATRNKGQVKIFLK